MAVPKNGTNVKPTGNSGGGTTIKGPVDPAHPGQLLPPQVPGGPWYKQKGANG